MNTRKSIHARHGNTRLSLVKWISWYPGRMNLKGAMPLSGYPVNIPEVNTICSVSRFRGRSWYTGR